MDFLKYIYFNLKLLIYLYLIYFKYEFEIRKNYPYEVVYLILKLLLFNYIEII